MKFNLKKSILSLLICASVVSTAVIYGGNNNTADAESTRVTLSEKLKRVTKTPKYIFLFIGDGISNQQIKSDSDYLGDLEKRK